MVARNLLGTPVIGSLNIGFVMIAVHILLSWGLAVAYGRIAAEKFDPLAAERRDGTNLRTEGIEMTPHAWNLHRHS